MALPAAIAAMIVLAGLAALANISATAAIRESAALRDVAVERLQEEALRARALYHLARHSRGELVVSSTFAVGLPDTSLVINTLAWPWHTFAVTAGGRRLFAEFARANIPVVPWCAAVVYVAAAHIATSTLTAAHDCADRTQVSMQHASSFDSALVANLHGVGGSDTLFVSTTVAGVLRATRLIVAEDGANVAGVVMAPVVRILEGAMIRGLVVATDSVRVESGSSVAADFNAVFTALSDRARLMPVGRRGLLVSQ